MMELVHEEVTAVTQARHGLDMVGSGEGRVIDGWLKYGAALLELRRDYAADRDFGREIERLGLNQYTVKGKTKKVHNHTRAAAMWATEFPDQFNQAWEDMQESTSIHMIYEHWKANYRLRPVRLMNATACTHKPSEAPEPYDWDAHHEAEPEPVITAELVPFVPKPPSHEAWLKEVRKEAAKIKAATSLPPIVPMEKRAEQITNEAKKVANELIKQLEYGETWLRFIKQYPELWKKLSTVIDTYKHIIEYQNSLDE